MTDLTKPIYNDLIAAREHLESIRWANGAFCPHCGEAENIYKLGGKAAAAGLWMCRSCKLKFTATVGTLFERSHIPLNKWLLAVHLMGAGKKGTSAHQLHRLMGITYKSAWFMAHRIREAMRTGGLAPMGGNGGAVEVDETFIGVDRTKKPKGERKGRGHHHKHKVLSLIDRKTRQARSVVVDDLKTETLLPILQENIAKEARVMTDEAGQYVHLSKHFAEHGIVHHGADEYVSQADPSIHTNTAEGYFSVFKRGMKGVYQHCGKQHLHRYVAEFDFRYNNRTALGVDDDQRATRALQGIEGKRLTYRRIGQRPNQ